MISVKNVSFSYRNSETGEKEPAVIRMPDMEIREGETVAVMGESGSGKTTLAKLLLGLVEPDSGEITGLGGLRVSMVFQEDRLLPWYSALDNVRAVRADRSAAMELLDEMELSEAAGKPIRELSGGMQRRVAIARALAFGGDLLILDEPLKGLDEELKKRVVPQIKKHFSTILLITHSEEEAALFGCEKRFRL